MNLCAFRRGRSLFLVLIWSLAVLLTGCTGMDNLYHAVDQFEYLVTLADLATATINTDFDVNWDNLYWLSEEYGVDVAGPAANFLMSAQELETALKQLQDAINQKHQEDLDMQALQKTLRGLY